MKHSLKSRTHSLTRFSVTSRLRGRPPRGPSRSRPGVSGGGVGEVREGGDTEGGVKEGVASNPGRAGAGVNGQGRGYAMRGGVGGGPLERGWNLEASGLGA